MTELSSKLERLRTEAEATAVAASPIADRTADVGRFDELQQELNELRHRNQMLHEQNDELQALVLHRNVEEGRSLLNDTRNSLAHELGEMSESQVSVN